MIKTFAFAASAIAASTIAASAAFIDFTDEAVADTLANGEISGSFGSITWTAYGTETSGFNSGTPTTVRTGINRLNADTPTGAGGTTYPAELAGDYDGLGIGNDELNNNLGAMTVQAVTIEFSDKVRLQATHFLDLYIGLGFPAKFGDNGVESGNVAVGGVPVVPEGASVLATDTNTNNVLSGVGHGLLDDVLVGTSFTFWAGFGKDDSTADVALAAVQVSAVPLPAGFLLLGTALGGLGLARRRKKA